MNEFRKRWKSFNKEMKLHEPTVRDLIADYIKDVNSLTQLVRYVIDDLNHGNAADGLRALNSEEKARIKEIATKIWFKR